jgi:hypothetical protein
VNRPESRGVPDVLVGKVGDDAAAIGAAILPLHFNFNPSRSLLLGRESASVQARITA